MVYPTAPPRRNPSVPFFVAWVIDIRILSLLFSAILLGMAWILVAVAAISLWAISLWRVRSCSSCLPSKPAFLSSAGSGKKRNVLLVVAHPDDESMFFAPTILFLSSEGHNLHILCISTGNAEGVGNVRKEEFYRACAILKIPLQQVKILDHPDLQDGFHNPWDIKLLATIIEDEIKMWDIDSLITFDKFGVSGHPNHCAVHHGIRMLLSDNSQRNTEAWELVRFFLCIHMSTTLFDQYKYYSQVQWPCRHLVVYPMLSIPSRKTDVLLIQQPSTQSLSCNG